MRYRLGSLRCIASTEQENAMPTKTLDPESLAVETFPTTPATVVDEPDPAIVSRTSCPGPPYCTC
jgi:hypothetical protein